MGEQGVAGVEAAHPHVAEELLQAVAPERAGAAAEVERLVDHLEGPVDDERPARDQPDRPVLVLHLGVVRHRPGQRDGPIRNASPLVVRRWLPTADRGPLSAREVDVLRLVAVGRPSREIGVRLFISSNTAANHVRSILQKTGCANRAQAVAYAARRHLLDDLC